MKPLIKWAGGKSNEIKYIKNTIPEFNRYIEPFFGGGAVFFNLQPKQAIINDISEDLTNFYKAIKKGNGLKIELIKFVQSWERINEYMEHFGKDIIQLYNKYKTREINYEQLKIKIQKLFFDKIVPFNGLFKKEFCINQKWLLCSIEINLLKKLKRTSEIIDKENSFSDNEIIKNIETAFRSGFYIHFRNIYNKTNRNEIKISKNKKIAIYYFIREFCYGGMFRFNKAGDFNVPYGGINYNSKDFRKKVEHLFSSKIKSALQNTTIENIDFEKLFNKYNFSKKDFIFLDPPYDTEFSDYEENPFTKKDQERLANCLIKTKANFILIIKETDFIRNLYENKKGIKITSFNKTYSYNIKSRNERAVKHLIIHNLKTAKL
jgi:DNA adenine methylase